VEIVLQLLFKLSLMHQQYLNQV